jgi:hypothetical protein
MPRALITKRLLKQTCIQLLLVAVLLIILKNKKSFKTNTTLDSLSLL